MDDTPMDVVLVDSHGSGESRFRENDINFDIALADSDCCGRRVSIEESCILSNEQTQIKRDTMGLSQPSTITYGNYIKNLYLDSEIVRDLLRDGSLDKILLATGTRLRRLDLSGCEHLSDRAFEGLACLNSSAIMKNPTFQYPCSHLMALSLQGCTGIPSVAIKRLLSVTKQLRILNLNRVYSVDDGVLDVVGSNCHSLGGISLNGCHQITDGGLLSVFKHFDAYKPSLLTEISLCDCFSISDKSMYAVAAFCPSLSYLRLTGCKKISDDSICMVVENCLKLQYLFLARCYITNRTLRSIKALSTSGRRSLLEYIDLAYAAEITLDAFMDVVVSCENLISIGLGACTQIISHAFIKTLSDDPNQDLPDHIRKNFCVFRGKDKMAMLKAEYRKVLRSEC